MRRCKSDPSFESSSSSRQEEEALMKEPCTFQQWAHKQDQKPSSSSSDPTSSSSVGGVYTTVKLPRMKKKKKKKKKNLGEDASKVVDPAFINLASSSAGMDEEEKHRRGLCKPCVYIIRGEDCPRLLMCADCHRVAHRFNDDSALRDETASDAQGSTTDGPKESAPPYRSRRPCKFKRKAFHKISEESMKLVEKDPLGFDPTEVILPSSMRSNSFYKDKFVARMNLHREWVLAGGEATGQPSPARLEALKVSL